MPTLNVGVVAKSVSEIGLLDTISTIVMFSIIGYNLIIE